MLGKTAGGIFWMFRYLERSENTARLIEAGFRIALTRPDSAQDEWASVLQSASVRDLYDQHHDDYDASQVVNFLLRDKANPSSVLSAFEAARNNARMVRTALTQEVWEAVNESWMQLTDALRRPVREADLPEALGLIRRHSALVRGATHGTMLRNDVFDFARVGTFLERADNTARILDVKYYVLLPSITQIGSSLDNVQWETILRSVAGQRSYRWLHGTDISPRGIAEFLILDSRMPRSLAFCVSKMSGNLGYLQSQYCEDCPSFARMQVLRDQLKETEIDHVFEMGLHEFIIGFLRDNADLAAQIEEDFRFNG
ncbi:alpha-E domain-containing protein [Actibacterium ureilyticum]|uniref:alpha-E domain-containing protein n=1 Tax=Actibacterium ureilyticum TaxID=1590614 RepID=UPI000BAACCAB|nr:alpha-E domain-containing protein [Actibacterium ureilyticum]